jgi:hypothetical protein
LEKRPFKEAHQLSLAWISEQLVLDILITCVPAILLCRRANSYVRNESSEIKWDGKKEIRNDVT